MNYKFSIVTISFNSVKSIEKTILSVLSQSYSNFEYIIIDGGSSDGTLDIIKKYSNKLRYISESDKGIYDAFNKGIVVSKGEYICFINTGDYYNLNYLEKIAIELKNFEVISSNIILIGNSYKVLKPTYPHCNFGRQPFLHPSLVVKRDLFKTIGNFNIQFKVFGDFEWMIRLLQYKFTYKYIDIADVYFDANGKSSAYNPVEYFKSLILHRNIIYTLFCSIRYTLFYIFYKFFYKND